MDFGILINTVLSEKIVVNKNNPESIAAFRLKGQAVFRKGYSVPGTRTNCRFNLIVRVRRPRSRCIPRCFGQPAVARGEPGLTGSLIVFGEGLVRGPVPGRLTQRHV
jgi:hypothetical protein